MNKLLPLIFALGTFLAASAHAMPIAPLSSTQARLTIQVGYGYGCAVGIYRGFFGRCVPVYVYRRGYCKRRHYDYPYVRYSGDTGVVMANKGACAFGSYLSCGHGTCWRFCY